VAFIGINGLRAAAAWAALLAVGSAVCALPRAAAHTSMLDRAADLTSALRQSHDEGLLQRDPRFGRTLDLDRAAEVNAALAVELDMTGGTISFWVKPRWSAGATESHTLLTATWKDPRRSYLALSQGWWEPSGSGRLYFIVSNEDVLHCSTDVPLPTSVWSLITVTWASGPNGFCRLYVDDELRAATQRAWTGVDQLDSLAVGSDRAASNARGRKASSIIAGLKVLRLPVSHREVIERYRREEDPRAFARKKWAWLQQAPPPDAKTAAGARVERAIFDEDLGWADSPQAIDTRLARIAAAGFNVYVPCVWHGGGAAYPSPVAPAYPAFGPKFVHGWDPLAYLVRAARARGISVHPWFTVVRREDYGHPEWAEPGTPAGAYDAHRPEFRAYMVELMLDVVRRYAVEGVNLDYIRAMGVCTSNYCRRDYRAGWGKELLADYADGAPTAEARARIAAWQDQAIAALVRDFALQARQLRPGLIISVDGHVQREDDTRPLEGRDEISWANRGWVDTIFQMDYRAEVDVTELAAGRRRLRDPGKLWLLFANYDLIDDEAVPRSAFWVSRVMRRACAGDWGAGVGVYLYGRLDDAQVAALGGAAGRISGGAPHPSETAIAMHQERR